MPNLRVLIAAAGAGSRSGLSYPKTLHPVLGRPILVRLMELMRPYDPVPVVVVSPAGREAVAAALAKHGLEAELVEQPAPTGMGDAILCFQQAAGWESTRHVVSVWGDIPLLARETVQAVIDRHLTDGNDFTFATRVVTDAYTVVERNASGEVRAILETRETGRTPETGERDIGLFAFRVEPVFELLQGRLPGAVGEGTGEHGFLYVVRHLAERGFKVEALPVATARDLISLNRLSDLSEVDHLTETDTRG